MSRKLEIAAFSLVLLLVFLLIQDNVFFWDTIQLGAKHALFFYETRFESLILPEEIDSGHPPLLGLLLAGGWFLFGKSLVVSHWVMFPFVWGIGYLLFQLGDFFLGRKLSFLLVMLVMLDPVMAGQAILISPDVILVFGFLLGWYSVLTKKDWGKILAALLLASISTRGMMVVLILFVANVYELWIQNKKISWRHIFRIIWPYIPSGLLAVSFLGYHYLETGWIGYHANSTWAPSFEKVDFAGLAKNVMVLVWRMLDFGRIFLWIILVAVFFRYWPGSKKWSAKQKSVLFIMTSAMVLFSISFLSYKGLQQHRYLLPVFISFNLFFIISIKQWIAVPKLRLGFISLGLVALISGNFWIYPDKISQGWDSTLAHWPYYSLRGKMLDYLEENNIPLKDVGTAFPEIGPLKYKDLSEKDIGMVEKDLNEQSYIFYSKVMNDFTDEEIDELRKNWQELRRWERRGIKLILYWKAEL